jgi:Holliday junction resolvase RusA-like endonuclease
VITIVIPGKPFAKQRPRMGMHGVYTPAATVSFERTVGQIAMQHFPKPLTGPVRLTVAATFCPPVSWTKRKVSEHLHRPHQQKPDLDNLLKAISDGLNRIAFVDDAQIVEIVARKVWGITEQTIVHVEAL